MKAIYFVTLKDGHSTYSGITFENCSYAVISDPHLVSNGFRYAFHCIDPVTFDMVSTPYEVYVMGADTLLEALEQLDQLCLSHS